MWFLPLLLSGAVEDVAVEKAESYMGTEWAWNGQGTAKNPGMVCMSLVFLAWSEASGVPRTKYPVDPSKTVSSGLLGAPVGKWLRGAEVIGLERGDVVYFLTTTEIPDEPLLTVGGTDYWPWHMGLYVGEGMTLHAEPGGVVRHQALDEVYWEALVATRPDP